MNGLSDDEREYLVSGGSSEVPNRFKQKIKTDTESFKKSVERMQDQIPSTVIKRLKEILDKKCIQNFVSIRGRKILGYDVRNFLSKHPLNIN